jgi:hypothetical protein
VYTLISNCWVENVFPTYFDIEISQQNFCMAFREFIKYAFRTMISHHWSLYIMYKTVSLTNPTPLTAHMIPLCIKTCT